ncbi:MAG: hypothetical protein HY738_11490 [Bacteroidia bacterium]|nr:hypothetical protein [Bacteroidia bacterium]
MSRKFPSETQPDAMDCGATCLKMVAKYYGKDYSIDTLRNLCYTSKDGVSLLSISETAEHLGFKTVGGRLNFEKVEKEALLPCIVHWKQEHFVVVHKILHCIRINILHIPELKMLLYDELYKKVSLYAVKHTRGGAK